MLDLAGIPTYATLSLGNRLWLRHAVRDLDVAGSFIGAAGASPLNPVGYSANVLGALVSYSRPFTERPNSVLNQTADQSRCFNALAEDLGANLTLHRTILQVRDEVLSLARLISFPSPGVTIRQFRQPDARCARLVRSVACDDFHRLINAMRATCDYALADLEAQRA